MNKSTHKHLYKEKWRPEDIERAAIRYCIEGTIQGTEREESIPASTIRHWRDTGRDEWDAAVVAYRDQNNDRFIATANKIIDSATKVTLDKLPSATAQQAATIGAIYYDKQRLALSLPGSYGGGDGGVQALQAAADLFHRLANDKVLVPKSKVIDGSLDKGE